ncbi:MULTISPECIES: SufD family Fe-S cluster assembly protein [unclassified Candidatus Cardinium]|uniref:SufB/SufD family protein n=1 Tax=unclassified Candidatus Cardinium TaxID=2641185 RepID=UPI001FB3C27E|nr:MULTISPECIES: SufD family Fe-S cluster assembly protein [unclassified Candidatus Cardinium]
MIAFRNWLQQAFKTFSATDPFYTERLTAFKKLDHPTFIASQKENYRKLREILALCTDQPYHVPIPTHPLLPIAVSGYGEATKATTLTFIDGIYAFADHLHPGIQLQRLADLPPLKQQAIWSSCVADMGSTNDLFLLLNTMLAQEIYLLELATATQATIILQHIVTHTAPHIVPQLILKIGQGSQVTLIENWYNLAGSVQPFVNHFTYVLLEETAHLAYHTLYPDQPSQSSLLAHQVNNLHCHQKAHSNFTHYSFAFGVTRLRIHLNVQIKGSHAHAGLYGLSTLGTTEQVAHQIQVVHSAPHSLSKQHYKSILGGASTSSFSGKIYLTPDAQQTNGYQTNNVLLLSDEAHHYTKPQLEIYADDVKCSHGATAGQLDETQLFYLQTRGIAAPLAKRLLLEAFGSEIIHSLSLPSLQDYLRDQLIAKLVKL